MPNTISTFFFVFDFIVNQRREKKVSFSGANIFVLSFNTELVAQYYHTLFLSVQFYGKENDVTAGWFILFRKKNVFSFLFSNVSDQGSNIYIISVVVLLVIAFPTTNCSILMRGMKFNEFLIKKCSWKSHELCEKCVVFSEIYFLSTIKDICLSVS